ncbi:MAG: VUT family protein [Clostridia bacterium]|nr:VUT family protein [Clostridia bacterium]
MRAEESPGLTAAKSIPAMTVCLLKSLPIAVTVIFIIDNLLMNLLAGYSIISLPWLALNWAITVSWISFLILDIVTKRFGPGAANVLSIIAAACNLTAALLCFALSKIFSNPALDLLLGGQWSVFTASTVAFILSAILNNCLNALIGRLFRKDPDGKAAYAARSFVSTFLSQFTDNFTFLFLAFFLFPMIPSALQVTWTIPQILGCSAVCAVLELVSEIVFSPIGYYTVKKWKEKNIGSAYIEKYGDKEE